MSSSRRRFLTTLSAAAAGGAAFARGTHSVGVERRRLPGRFHRTACSPTELLKKHASETLAAGKTTGETQSDPQMPSAAEVESSPYTDRRNWGRWGPDDQKGAINLITPREERRRGRGWCVPDGQVSTSRVFEPEQHFMRKNPRPGGAIRLGGGLLRVHLPRS